MAAPWRDWRSTALLALLLAGGCSDPATPDGAAQVNQDAGNQTQVQPSTRKPVTARDADALARLFDCVRTGDSALVSAHRGGPGPGLPENALITLAAGRALGIRLFEVDVATTRDGVLLLYHDDALGRTSTGAGIIADIDHADLAGIRLKDSNGRVGEARITQLAEALDWAVRNDAVLGLDIKRSTRFEDVIDAVGSAAAQGHVYLISYSLGAARKLHRLAPELIISLPLADQGDLRAARAAGIADDRMLAWTGLGPDVNAGSLPARAFEAAKVEIIYGTLGRAGQRLDDRFAADGVTDEYAGLVDAGVRIIATDAPRVARRQLLMSGKAADACWAAP